MAATETEKHMVSKRAACIILKCYLVSECNSDHNGFLCDNDDCIPISFVCDGDNDCGGWEDEGPECADGKSVSAVVGSEIR